MAEMFFKKFFSLIFLLQYLWRWASLVLLSLVTYPVWEPISKALTVTFFPFRSVSKWLYLSIFMVCAAAILCSAGHVSSRMDTAFFCLSTITMSGFCRVTATSGGRVPQAWCWWPGMSMQQVYFSLSRQVAMYFKTPSCLQVNLPSCRARGQQLRMWFRVSFTPHLHLSLVLFPHRLRFALVGRVSKEAFKTNFIVPFGKL